MEKMNSYLKCCCSCLNAITIEPYLFLGMWSFNMYYPMFMALVKEKSCLHLYEDPETCKDYDNEVEAYASRWILYCNIGMAVPCIFMAMFMGSWSDHVSRKFVLVLQPVGGIIVATSGLLNAYYTSWSLIYLVIGSTLSGFFGGFSTFIMSSYSYLSDICSEKSRTMRMGLCEGAIFFGGASGLVFGGLMKDSAGNVVVFSVVLGGFVLNLIYVLVRIRDIPRRGQSDQETVAERSCCTSVFNLRYLIVGFKALLKRRGYDRRFHLILLVLCLTILYFHGIGESDVAYLYTTHPPISFTSTIFGYYMGLKYFMQSFGVLIILPLLTRCGLTDMSMAQIGLISRISSMVLLAFSQNAWMVFLVPIVGVLTSLPSPCMRSLITKNIDRSEYGSILAVIASLETIITLVASAVFNNLYPATLQWMPGFSFICMAEILLIPFIFTRWVGKGTVSVNNIVDASETEDAEHEDLKAPLLDEEEE